jgi:P27 family predicted phage terminase small subunit
MTRPRVQRPPKHLKPETRKWWSAVVARYVLEDHHVRLLTLAAESWDRAAQAREVVLREGVTFVDRKGEVKRHPATLVEASAQKQFREFLKALDLDTEPDGRR